MEANPQPPESCPLPEHWRDDMPFNPAEAVVEDDDDNTDVLLAEEDEPGGGEDDGPPNASQLSGSEV